MESIFEAEWDNDFPGWYINIYGKFVPISFDLMESLNIPSSARKIKVTCHIKVQSCTNIGTSIVLTPIRIEN